jgi:exodeoxyribonuclease VIII
MTEAYDRIDGLNWSTLKLMENTPARARHLFDHPEEIRDKAAYVSGRAVHCKILEPDRFDDEYVYLPDFGDGRTKAAKQAKSEWLLSVPDGAQIISEADFRMAERCSDYVHNDKDLRSILSGGEYEKAVTWEIDGVKCKGRIDFLKNRVVDLKLTRHDSVDAIMRDAEKYNYHGQVAWYHDGCVRAGLISGEVLPLLVFIHASHGSSFVDKLVLDMINGTYEDGKRKYQKYLSRYMACTEAGWWPGMCKTRIFWLLSERKINEDLDE